MEPKEIHDANRVYPSGEGSFEEIMDSLRYARNKAIPITATAVFSRQGVGRVKEIYTFFKEQRISFRLNPIHASNSKQHYTVTPSEYASAMTELIDLYLADPDDDIRVINADQFIKIVLGDAMRSSDGHHIEQVDVGKVSDVFSSNCQGLICAVAPDGSIFPCEILMDHDEFIYGHITDGLENVLGSITRSIFVDRVKHLEDCRDCEFWTLCYGGCPSHAFSLNRDIRTKDPMCEAYKIIFAHVRRRMGEALEVGYLAQRH